MNTSTTTIVPAAATYVTSGVSATAPIVFVVDDDASIRESLELLIEGAGWRAATFATSKEFLARPRAAAPSCLVLDMSLPAVDGVDLQKRLATDRPDMPVIVISGCNDVRLSVQAMKAGAVEFLTKPVCDALMVDALHQALERSRRALDRGAKLTCLHQSYTSLTRRERQVMMLVASGLLNKQIGAQLGISEITVKAHRGQVMRKMNAESLPALVHMAASLGLTAAFA